MISKEKLDRINELSRKCKVQQLSSEEAAEQAELRREYIAAYKDNVRCILDNTVVQYPDGTKVPLKDRNKPRDSDTENKDN